MDKPPFTWVDTRLSHVPRHCLSIDKNAPITLSVNAGSGSIDVTKDVGGGWCYLSAYQKTTDYIGQLDALTIDFSAAMNTQHNAARSNGHSGRNAIHVYSR